MDSAFFISKPRYLEEEEIEGLRAIARLLEKLENHFNIFTCSDNHAHTHTHTHHTHAHNQTALTGVLKHKKTMMHWLEK